MLRNSHITMFAACCITSAHLNGVYLLPPCSLSCAWRCKTHREDCNKCGGFGIAKTVGIEFCLTFRQPSARLHPNWLSSKYTSHRGFFDDGSHLSRQEFLSHRCLRTPFSANLNSLNPFSYRFWQFGTLHPIISTQLFYTTSTRFVVRKCRLPLVSITGNRWHIQHIRNILGGQ